MSRTRILIAEDNSALRYSLVRLLSARFDVVGSVGDGMALLREYRALAADVLVTDISMPGLTGLEAMRLLQREAASAKIVIFSVHDDRELVQAAMELGAKGYVLKSAGDTDLIPAIEAVAGGGRFLSSALRGAESDL